MQIYGSLNQSNETTSGPGATRNLFLIGLALTGLNPFFIIWWLTIGVNLILVSLEFAGLGGVVFMYACHVWVDYVWLTLVATFAKRGAKFLRHKVYHQIIAIFGAVLIYFGLSFIIDALGI